MLTLVLAYDGHKRDAKAECIFIGHDAEAAEAAIADADEKFVRVEIYKNPVPVKRRNLEDSIDPGYVAEADRKEQKRQEQLKQEAEENSIPQNGGAGEAGASTEGSSEQADDPASTQTSDSVEPKAAEPPATVEGSQVAKKASTKQGKKK